MLITVVFLLVPPLSGRIYFIKIMLKYFLTVLYKILVKLNTASTSTFPSFKKKIYFEQFFNASTVLSCHTNPHH